MQKFYQLIVKSGILCSFTLIIGGCENNSIKTVSDVDSATASTQNQNDSLKTATSSSKKQNNQDNNNIIVNRDYNALDEFNLEAKDAPLTSKLLQINSKNININPHSDFFVFTHNQDLYEIELSNRKVTFNSKLDSEYPIFSNKSYSTDLISAVYEKNIFATIKDKTLYTLKFDKDILSINNYKIPEYNNYKLTNRQLIASNKKNGFFAISGLDFITSPDGIEWTYRNSQAEENLLVELFKSEFYFRPLTILPLKNKFLIFTVGLYGIVICFKDGIISRDYDFSTISRKIKNISKVDDTNFIAIRHDDVLKISEEEQYFVPSTIFSGWTMPIDNRNFLFEKIILTENNNIYGLMKPIESDYTSLPKIIHFNNETQEWSELTNIPKNVKWKDISIGLDKQGLNRLVVVGNNVIITSSDDGKSWKQIDFKKNSDSFNFVIYGDRKFLIQ